MNCTQGVYRANHAGEWEMYNLVRENGRSHARLTAWAESGYGPAEGRAMSLESKSNAARVVQDIWQSYICVDPYGCNCNFDGSCRRGVVDARD